MQRVPWLRVRGEVRNPADIHEGEYARFCPKGKAEGVYVHKAVSLMLHYVQSSRITGYRTFNFIESLNRPIVSVKQVTMMELGMA